MKIAGFEGGWHSAKSARPPPVWYSGQVEGVAQRVEGLLPAGRRESLRGVVDDALRTIEADTAAAVGRLSALLLRGWLRPLVVGLIFSFGIVGGSWPGMRWLWMNIEDRLETLAVLQVDIEQARQTLTAIEETTWGVELREIDGERFVVLPAGTLDHAPWTVGGQPAVKLSSE